jgi:hypothetical protein
MKTVMRRIRQLEDQFGPADGKLCTVLVVCNLGQELALDQDRCVEILAECGFLPTGPIGLVNICHIPNGLTAEGTEMFLRENGAEICGRDSLAAAAPWNPRFTARAKSGAR